MNQSAQYQRQQVSMVMMMSGVALNVALATNIMTVAMTQ